jgi:hypothetical protein
MWPHSDPESAAANGTAHTIAMRIYLGLRSLNLINENGWHFKTRARDTKNTIFPPTNKNAKVRVNKHPNLMVHEFETLLFVNLVAFTPWTDSDHCLTELHKVRRTTVPDDINAGLSSAPSKRIKAVMPRYQKTFHGPLITIDIGLDAMRRECPHFNAWLAKIEALNPN